jgi:hypothetical protein
LLLVAQTKYVWLAPDPSAGRGVAWFRATKTLRRGGGIDIANAERVEGASLLGLFP